MSLIQIDRDPARRQLNLFGLIWLLFFGIIGGFVLKNGSQQFAGFCIWGLAVVVPAIGWASPKFMRIVYVGMAYLTLPIGFVVSLLILAMVYYCLLTPIGLVMRLIGYDAMNRQFESSRTTYWEQRECSAGDNLERYFDQF